MMCVKNQYADSQIPTKKVNLKKHDTTYKGFSTVTETLMQLYFLIAQLISTKTTIYFFIFTANSNSIEKACKIEVSLMLFVA